LIGAFAPGLRVLAPVLRDVTQFIWRVTSRRANLVRARNASPSEELRDFSALKNKRARTGRRMVAAADKPSMR
jgi:hypothetical protein